MTAVNTLTKKGRDLLDQVEHVETLLAGCVDDDMNRAVSALAGVVRDMLTNTQPLWEKQETR
jgi:hypothetical protein